MAETNVNVLENPKTVGMDMKAPFGIYVDGVKVAEYAKVEDANQHYLRLARYGHSAKQSPFQ